MSRQLRRLNRRVSLMISAALPLCLALSACGGGGGAQVASIPPPAPTPTPKPAVTLDVRTSWVDSVGTREGNYSLMGRLALTPSSGGPSSSRLLSAGEAEISIAKQNGIFGYTLSAPGIFPAGASPVAFNSPEISWSATNDPVNPQIFEDDQNGTLQQFLGQLLVVYRKSSDGSEEESESYFFRRGSSFNGSSSFTYDLTYSYVAMGEWSSSSVQPGASSRVDLLFVNGDRTPAAGIPVSGTATYDAHTLNLRGSGYGEPGLPFTLTADFAQRSISAQINQNYSLIDSIEDPVDIPIPGIHVSGSAPFNNDGTFDIPLAGTVNYSAVKTATMPPSEAVTGMMDGAFFGPNAENVGGTFGLNRADGTLMLQDAFVGQQHH